MMPRGKLAWGLLTLLFVLWPQTVRAGGRPQGPPPGPDRVRWIEETYIAYTWWLVRWTDDAVACEIVVEHPGAPAGAEIYEQCGPDVYQVWTQTAPCTEEEKTSCAGYYLFFTGQEERTRPAPSPLPPARIWLTAGRCLPQGLGVWCPESPALTLVGEEPLDGYQVTEIAGQLDETPFSCREAICTLPLSPAEGVHRLTVWGFSSYGDSTEVQEMLIQVLPLETGWQLSLVSETQQAWPQPFCAEYWQAFPPPPEALPSWLSPDVSLTDLHTAHPFSLLAGRLLENGLAGESPCPQGGVDAAGWATDCGLRAALPQVTAWQNRFDPLLLQIGEQYQAPPLLLKSLFAYESQLWPGQGAEGHAGFGQLTISGADLALMWNPRLYEQFCAQVYAPDVCQRGYWGLSESQRLFLQQALYARMDAACPACPGGVNLPRAEASIALFAETLRASCAQTGAVITNVTGQTPGDLFSYVDLWKLTLANYHAGAGCLGDALRAAQGDADQLTWEQVAAAFPQGCSSAVPYVEAVVDGP